MELSVNDTFKTKEDLIQSISDYANSIHFKFTITETPRTLSFVCKGKQEFNCDASIVTAFKKKDDCFSIKRMKLTHKCPIANNDFASTDEFLRNEIFTNISDYSTTRIGEIVSILYNRGIRVSYSSVFNILNKDPNKDFIKDLNKDKNDMIREFSNELLNINSDKLEVNINENKMFFYKVKEYINILYPIVEIKYYKRKEGLAIFGVLYDPVNEPVIYTCCVSEDSDEEGTIKYFLSNTAHDKYIIEYDSLLIKVLEEEKIDYFVKTREVCKHVYGEEITKENLEEVWNLCNNTNDTINDTINELGSENKENNTNTNQNIKNQDSENSKNLVDFIKGVLHIDESHFLKSKSNMKLLNINNLPECDLDFINYGVYSLSFLECINAIIKLSNDNLRLKKRFVRQDPKSLFGYNVTNRIERNESTIPKEECQVDLEKGTCECGMYQELLIPCVHVCKYLREQRLDPYLYVSSVYSKDQYSKLEEIQPVMNINIKVSSDRFNFKKGPGRPKKSFGKEVEIVVE